MLFSKCKAITLLTPGRVFSGTFTATSPAPGPRKLRMEKGKKESPKGKDFSSPRHSWSVIICKHLLPPSQREQGRFQHQEVTSDNAVLQLPSNLSIFLLQKESIECRVCPLAAKALHLHQHHLLQLLWDLSRWVPRVGSIASPSVPLFDISSRNIARSASLLAFLFCTRTTFN